MFLHVTLNSTLTKGLFFKMLHEIQKILLMLNALTSFRNILPTLMHIMQHGAHQKYYCWFAIYNSTAIILVQSLIYKFDVYDV